MNELEATLLFEEYSQRAKDLVGNFISLRSAYCSEERRKVCPDHTKIELLEEEILFFMALRSRVTLMSQEELAQLIAHYQPLYKEENSLRTAR